MGNTISLVIELIWIVLIEILQSAFLQNIGVQSCYAVNAKGANYSQTSHMNLAILNNGQLMNQILIPWILGTNLIEEATVNLVNNHVDTWQQILEQISIPLLQSLWQNGVVGVGYSVAGNIPSYIPIQTIIINKYPHQLSYCYCWMGIVNLDAYFVCKGANIIMGTHEMTYNALYTSRYKEVLLNQTEALALIGAIIWIQELSNLIYLVAVLLTFLNLIIGKTCIIGEILICLSIPKTQGIYSAVLIANNRYIIRHCSYLSVIIVNSTGGTIIVNMHISLAAKTNLYSLVRLTELPGKAIAQPVIWNLNLLAINNLLLKKAILIADTAAMSSQAQRSHGINEAGCQTAQAAITQTCIWLFLIKVMNIQIQILQHCFQGILQIQINHIGIQKTSQQELDGEIINLLLIVFLILLVSFNPIFRSILLYDLCQGLIKFMFAEVRKLTAIIYLGCGNKTLLQLFFHGINVSLNY